MVSTAKKIYCRAFQWCLRVVIPILPYREPAKLTSVTQVPDVLKQKKKKCVLLVTDTSVRGFGLTQRLEQALAEAGIRCIVFDQTPVNPTCDAVELAAGRYRSEECQAIISVGGGSCIDCGKLVGVRIARPRKSFASMEGILKVLWPLPLHIAIPTTAGTGSETTIAAVILDERRHFKFALEDFPLTPRYTCHDPELTFTLPKGLTATTGMDALTHAVEAFIGQDDTPHTRSQAIEATRLINSNLLTAYNEPTNRAARANMLHAAYLAGMAFTVSYVGYVHAVAHSLGGQYNIPHGLANAVLLPIVLRKYGKAIEPKLALLAREAGVSRAADDAQAAEEFIRRVEEHNRLMSIPTTLQGIADSDIAMMARNAEHEANPLYPVPVLWGTQELEEIYHLVKV
ncbi:MAG: iron-containing alcohol dehydrogenase [Bacteroidaceae bacterium]|nr:iron-containing alcohol dehydrogenase [Bacteroidaceae bacterium]